MRLLIGLFLIGCHNSVDHSPVADTRLDSAPAVVLLAELSQEGDIDVQGAVTGELYVDLDDIDDDRFGFRYSVQTQDGTELFARTAPGPLQVRDYLGYYGEQSGFSILEGFPFLGDFPVPIPLLDGAERVVFETREADTDYVEVGRYDLDRLSGDEVGTSESVVDHTLLYESGPSENRLDIVLMGDGYTEDQLDDWYEDAADLADAIISTEPMAGLADHINIHRVDAVSLESGISYDCVGTCEMRDTAFSSVFALNWVNALLGTNYSTRSIFQMDQWEVARAASVVPWDVVVIVGNTDTYGGMAVHYATVTNARASWLETGVHEMAHILGALGDEYENDECIISGGNGLPPNVTDDPTSPPWPQWIDDDTPLPTPDTHDYADVVGAFEGAYNCPDLYRPARSCRMENSSAGDFCPVCAESLARRLFRYADPTDGLNMDLSQDKVCFSTEGPDQGYGLSAAVDGTEVAVGIDEVCVPLPEPGSEIAVTVSLAVSAVRVEGGELEQVFTWQVP